MILEGIFNILFGILGGFLSFLPDVQWEVDASVFTTFLEILRVAGYILPMDTVAAVFSLVIALGIFRIIVSLIKTIWNLIPLL